MTGGLNRAIFVVFYFWPLSAIFDFVLIFGIILQLFWSRLTPNINNTSNRQSIQPVQKGLFQVKEFGDSPSTKMIESEKLCLQWNEFQNIVSSAFEDLRSDGELTDVTLACEDGKQIEAHKVVLSATILMIFLHWPMK